MWNKRIIKNFNPNKKEGNALSKKRLSSYWKIISILLALEILGIVILWVLFGSKQVKIIGIPLTILHFLATITFFVIFDNGAANRLRKTHFKIKELKTLEQGHTYYYALKVSGFKRLIINLLLTIIVMSISLITFFI